MSSAGEEHGPTFWILLVVGWIAIAIGLFGVFDHPRQASAFNVFRLLVGLNIVNDALAIPALLVGCVCRPEVDPGVVPCPCPGVADRGRNRHAVCLPIGGLLWEGSGEP